MGANRELRLGFVALTDCAPLVIAKERGFFRRHGLSVLLQREPSWANIRDKLVAGVLDAAQALAPMTLSTTLGLDGLSTPLLAPMSLGLGGNAITVSTALWLRMLEADPVGALTRPTQADALRAVIRADRREGRPPLRFGVVFPFSCHDFELRYWMAAAGVDPTRDVEVRVVPPVRMAESLRRGDLDGFCVGEPWNHLAVDEGIGRSLISKHEIWNSSPEKVLAVTEPWADANPELLRALLRALIEAASWLDESENRREAVHVIAGESFVDAPARIVAGSMEGRFRLDRDVCVSLPDFHVFHRHAASFPWTSHAAWFLCQMLRWGSIEKPIDVAGVAAQVYRPDLYREAAEELGERFPDEDQKIEGVHAEPWTLRTAQAPLSMGPDRFLDGRVFDPGDPIGYLEHTEISAMRVRLDDLAWMNA